MVRAAKGFVEDVGRSAASSSGGLLDLARCSEQNAERDCQRVLVGKHKLALPVTESTLDVEDPPNIPLLKLRHWAQFLADGNHLHILTGLKKSCWKREEAILEKFWRHFRAQEPQHEIFREADAGRLRLSHTYPMLLHGDEGRGRKRNAFLVLNFHSVMGMGLRLGRKKTSLKKNAKRRAFGTWLRMRPNYAGSTLCSRFLFAALPKALYTNKNEHVWNALMEAAAEEAKFMFGVGVEDTMHGRGRINMCIIRICGDWPWLVDSGELRRSFRNVQKHKTRKTLPVGICHQCMAGQVGYDFEEINTVQPRWLETMFSQSLSWEGAEPAALAQIPHSLGQTAALWTYDIFHTVHLGVGRSFLASFLVLLAELQPESNIDDRFVSLTDDYTSWCKRASRRAHLQKITKELVGYPTTRTYPNGTWHKGDLTTVLMAYVQHRFGRDGASWSPMMKLAGKAATYLNTTLATMYNSDVWLTPGEARHIGGQGMLFLKAYASLARMAMQEQLFLWVLQPKLHSFHHLMITLLEGASKGHVLNTVVYGAQADEDFIGRPSRLSRRVTAFPVMSSKRVVSRHLQISWSEWVRAGYIIRPKAPAKQ